MIDNVNWERIVVVAAVHGEKFIGWVPEDVGDPKKYLEKHGAERTPITLQDVRNLVGQASPNLDANGNILGVSKLLLLMPIDMFNGPLFNHHVVPSSWYFPAENEKCKRKIEELLHHAVETEARLSAAEAGIHLAGMAAPTAIRRKQ